MKLRVFGHSDDCVEIRGPVKEEFYSPGSITLGTERTGGLFIKVGYGRLGPYGGWTFSTVLIGCDVPLPASWAVSIEPEHEYSPAFCVDCPDNTPITIKDSEDRVIFSAPSLRDSALSKLTHDERAALGVV